MFNVLRVVFGLIFRGRVFLGIGLVVAVRVFVLLSPISRQWVVKFSLFWNVVTCDRVWKRRNFIVKKYFFIVFYCENTVFLPASYWLATG